MVCRCPTWCACRFRLTPARARGTRARPRLTRARLAIPPRARARRLVVLEAPTEARRRGPRERGGASGGSPSRSPPRGRRRAAWWSSRRSRRGASGGAGRVALREAPPRSSSPRGRRRAARRGEGRSRGEGRGEGRREQKSLGNKAFRTIRGGLMVEVVYQLPVAKGSPCAHVCARPYAREGRRTGKPSSPRGPKPSFSLHFAWFTSKF